MRRVFSHSRSWAPKVASSRASQPSSTMTRLGAPVSRPSMPMEQIGEHRRRRGRADQAFGLEGLHLARTDPLDLSVEQPAPGSGHGVGLQGALERHRLQQHREAGKGALGHRRGSQAAQRRPQVVLDLRGDRHAFARQHRSQPFRRPVALGRIVDPRQRLQGDAGFFLIRERAAEVVEVAAHGQGRRPDRAAEVEGEHLGGGIAPELQRHQRQQHALAGAGGTHHQGMADVADMGGQAKRRRALGPPMEQRRPAQVLVALRPRPDRRQRDHVGEVQGGDRRLADIGVGVARQGPAHTRLRGGTILPGARRNPRLGAPDGRIRDRRQRRCKKASPQGAPSARRDDRSSACVSAWAWTRLASPAGQRPGRH